MRIVVLSSSVYSETGCAMAVRMAQVGYVPVGALVLSTFNSGTLLRKIGQWGIGDVARYTRMKLVPHRGNQPSRVRNPYLRLLLEHGGGVFRDLRQVAAIHRFPVVTCGDQNSPDSIAQLREWSPDLIIFTGGNILWQQLLQVPRLGVLNVHLGLLPEIRGMSSPEWSLLNHVPPGVTIHYMDAGIDTGPIIQRWELPESRRCESLSDLRDKLVAFGVEKIGEVVASLNCGTMSATPQLTLDSADREEDEVRAKGKDKDNQYFVMHEWLQAKAAACLTKSSSSAAVAAMGNGRLRE
jgi:folate-dependent phosphoribosylglycinamide formyltransferase PurN